MDTTDKIKVLLLREESGRKREEAISSADSIKTPSQIRRRRRMLRKDIGS
jgi:hypothetical protein